MAKLADLQKQLPKVNDWPYNNFRLLLPQEEGHIYSVEENLPESITMDQDILFNKQRVIFESQIEIIKEDFLHLVRYHYLSDKKKKLEERVNSEIARYISDCELLEEKTTIKYYFDWAARGTPEKYYYACKGLLTFWHTDWKEEESEEEEQTAPPADKQDKPSFVFLLKKLLQIEHEKTEKEANDLVNLNPDIVMHGMMKGNFFLSPTAMALLIKGKKNKEGGD